MEALDIETLKSRIFFRRLIQGLIILVIFLMAITSINHENDLFWQLKMGETIFEQHYFPIKDPYSFTSYGGVWTLEEWLPGVLFYLIFKELGPGALILLKAVIIALTFSLFFVLFNKLKVNLYLSVLVLLLAAMVNTRGIWSVFPSIFEYLFLSLTLFILEYSKQYTWKKTVLPLVLISFLWANSHASFFLMTFVLVSYIAGDLISQRLKKIFPSFDPTGNALTKADKLKLIFVSLVSLITPFLTPNGYWTFIYPFRISFSTFTAYVNEYHKYWEIWSWNWNDFVNGFTFILIVGVILIFTLSIKKLNPRDVLLAIIFIGLSQQAVRHVAIFALMALFLISKYIKIWFGEYRGVFKRSLIKDILLILLIICFVYYYKTNMVKFGLGLSEKGYPKEAAEFVISNKIAGEMFNHYNYGGYLIWKMPSNKVFIDGRLEMYLGKTGDDYLTILHATSNYKQLIDSYHVNFFLLYATDPIIGVLADDPNWKFVHFSDQYVVFIKNSPDNQKVISENWSSEKQTEFKQAYGNYVALDLNDQGLDQIKKGNLLKALDLFQQAVSRNPGLLLAHLNLALGYMDIGWWREAADEYQRVLELDPANELAKANQVRAEKLYELSKREKL